MTSAQMQITFAHRPILKLACKSSLPLYKKKYRKIYTTTFDMTDRPSFSTIFSCFRLMVVIFLSPVIHYLTIGIDKVGTHRSELGEKGKLSWSQNIVFSTFMTLWHISTTLMIMGFLVWYFWQCFLMTPSHQSGQRKNHCKENIPRAEYYFLCEDILYSMCIHKKKAMKAGQSIM